MTSKKNWQPKCSIIINFSELWWDKHIYGLLTTTKKMSNEKSDQLNQAIVDLTTCFTKNQLFYMKFNHKHVHFQLFLNKIWNGLLESVSHFACLSILRLDNSNIPSVLLDGSSFNNNDPELTWSQAICMPFANRPTWSASPKLFNTGVNNT